MNIIEEYAASIEKLDEEKILKFRKHWDSLFHVTGSLGELEEISIRICAILNTLPQSIDKKASLVMCADNGIYEANVSSSPKVLTKLLATQMGEGKCAMSVISKSAGADVFVYDLGIENFQENKNVINKRISNGTKNFLIEDAMTYQEAIKSIEIGIDEAEKLIKKGYQILGTGELGMANTTTSSIIIKAFTGLNHKEIVGLGSGVDSIQLDNKLNAVKNGLNLRKPNLDDPIDVLAKVGGYDIGAMAGVFLASAKNNIPAVIDGIISASAALLAYKINPNVKDYLFASHNAREKGAKVALDYIGLKGPLDLNMRLGEGTGCPVFFKLVDTGIDCMNNMTSFEEVNFGNYAINIRDKDERDF